MPDLRPELGIALQEICRKDGLEYARRCPNVEGFILWLLIDFGQYTEGLLDDFWQPKGVSADEFRACNDDTVILLAQEGNRCLALGPEHSVPLAVSHYGESDLCDCVLHWSATGGPLSVTGEIEIPLLKNGELTQAGAANLNLPDATEGCKIELKASLYHGDRLVNTNDWRFWGLPDTKPLITVRTAAATIPPGTTLVVADAVDAQLADYIDSGGTCLLFSSGSAIEEPTGVYRGYTTFRTIPWNGGPGNSGTVINKHPALAGFPHDGVCDFQFAWLIKTFHPMNFEQLRRYDLEPIIRGIDFYQTTKNLAYLMEFNIGKGKVLVTSLGVLPQLSERLEARCLLNSLVDYASGSAMTPAASVPKEEFLRLFSPLAAK